MIRCDFALVVLVLMTTLGFGQDGGPGKLDLSREVGTIFRKKCIGCHGAAVQSSGLRLDEREGAMRGGYSGKVILPGNGFESRLVKIVSGEVKGLIMPPAGSRLPAGEIQTLRKWIDQGAEWPDVAGPASKQLNVRQSDHWAFQPIRRPAIPRSGDDGVIRNPIDSFVLAKLEIQGIKPAPEAPKDVLARRAYLDVTGLPPSPEELDNFLMDVRLDAYERLVDKLLASPHYGEKWGRYWLDLARYAESDGYSADFLRPWAWRYRDWVIDAFNRDLAFDRFTIEQIAGDLLPDATDEQRIATGFLRNNLTDVEAGVDLNQTRFEQTIDRTNAVGTVWLGLTVSCAQCHDHKFDPFSQKEYYQLFAFFDRTEDRDIEAPLPGELGSYLRTAGEYARRRQALFEEFNVDKWQSWWEQKMLSAAAHPGMYADWDFVWTQWGSKDINYTVIKMRPARRTPLQRRFITDNFLRMMSFPASKAEYEANHFKDLIERLKTIETEFPPLSRAQTIAELNDSPATHLRVRGNFQAMGIEVQPNTPGVLPSLSATGQANRLTLARWLVSADNPLTARVAVSRFWQELLGKGLVSSSDNFGLKGARPTHPELLDWLANDFQDSGWSMKHLIRTIVTSATYRQSSVARPELDAVDPENKLFARQTRFRLSAELIRDRALAAGGLLNVAIGGPSIRPALPPGALDAALNARDPKALWQESKGRDLYRRSIYIHHQRRLVYPPLAIFDEPSAAQSCPMRDRSNTPLQALNLLNDPVVFECARGFATRVLKSSTTSLTEQVNYAFRLALGRSPTKSEQARAEQYFKERAKLLQNGSKALNAVFPSHALDTDPITSATWVGLGRVLMNLDEFITRE